jgi:exosortase/archaeosortase family protein
MIRSARSPLIRRHNLPEAQIVFLMLTSIAVRAMAQVLGISLLGGLMLAVDVFAIAYLLKLPYRRFAVSPWWLACLFIFALPVEGLAQRLIGYPLQHLSASLACVVLATGFESASCEGIRIFLNQREVLVDLPCSGARLLSLAGALFAYICALRQPGVRSAAWGLALCLTAVCVTNALRISVLAVGLAYADTLSVDVMAPLPHTIIGLGATLTTAWILFVWCRSSRSGEPRGCGLEQPSSETTSTQLPTSHLRGRLFLACVLSALAVGVINLPTSPLDISSISSQPHLPLYLAGHQRIDLPLTDMETDYYTQYGGSAARASYGPFALLVVETTSPLRHLHDPALCMRGMGYDVRFIGTHLSSAISFYRATSSADPESEHIVEVSYVSEDGRFAGSIAEVVWTWFRHPGTRWQMIQKIIPASFNTTTPPIQAWRTSVTRAFNLPMET